MASTSSSLSILINEAKEALFDDNFQLAHHLLSKAILLVPTNAELYIDRAQTSLKLSNFSDAIEDADHGIALNPLIPKAYLRKASAFMELREFEKARNTLEFAAGMYPEYSKFGEMISDCDARMTEGNGVSVENKDTFVKSIEASGHGIDFGPGFMELYDSLLKIGYTKENAKIALELIGHVPKDDKEVPVFGVKDLQAIHDMVDAVGTWLPRAKKSWLTSYELVQLGSVQSRLREKETLVNTYLLKKNGKAKSGEAANELNAEILKKEGKGRMGVTAGEKSKPCVSEKGKLMPTVFGISKSSEEFEFAETGQEITAAVLHKEGNETIVSARPEDKKIVSKKGKEKQNSTDLESIDLKVEKGKSKGFGKGKTSIFTDELNQLLVDLIVEAEDKIKRKEAKGGKLQIASEMFERCMLERKLEGFNLKKIYTHTKELNQGRIRINESLMAKLNLKKLKRVPANELKANADIEKVQDDSAELKRVPVADEVEVSEEDAAAGLLELAKQEEDK